MLFLFVLWALVASKSQDLTMQEWNALGTSPHRFVKVYAPWCGHCKNLAPAWDEVAFRWGGADDAKVVSIDADAHRDVAQAWDIKGFPTILYFGAGVEAVGDAEPYVGARETKALAAWVEEKSGVKPLRDAPPPPPPAPETYGPTAEEFDAIVAEETRPLVVAFTAPWCGHCKNLKPTWKKVMEAYADSEDVRVLEVDAAAQKTLAQRYQIGGFPTIKFVFPKAHITTGGEVEEPYRGARSEESIRAWIDAGVESAQTIPDDAGRIEVCDAFAAAIACTGSQEERNALLAAMKMFIKQKSAEAWGVAPTIVDLYVRFATAYVEDVVPLLDDEETVMHMKIDQDLLKETNDPEFDAQKWVLAHVSMNIIRAFRCPTEHASA